MTLPKRCAASNGCQALPRQNDFFFRLYEKGPVLDLTNSSTGHFLKVCRTSDIMRRPDQQDAQLPALIFN